MSILRSVTNAGWAVMAIAVASYAAGWWLGWLELMIVAAGCGIVMIFAVVAVLGRFPFAIEREVEPRRLTVGQEAFGFLQVANTGRVPAFPRTAQDAFGDRPIPVKLPALRAGATHDVRYPLPTDHRGVFRVGPVTVARADPLGLLRRERTYGEIDEFWVYPRTHSIRLSAAGITKDLDGPTSDSSPQGGVAFHTIRPYEMGDDFRLVHWRSTAKRGGELMVRHFVDNRRPQLTVVLDTHAESYGASIVGAPSPSFELGVEVVASLSAAAQRVGMPASIHGATADGDAFSGSHPGAHLDEAAAVTMQSTVAAGDFLTALSRATSQATTLVLVTGAIDPAAIDVALRSVRQVPNLMVIRCAAGGSARSTGSTGSTGSIASTEQEGDPGEVPPPHPSVQTFDVASGEQFVAAWDVTQR